MPFTNKYDRLLLATAGGDAIIHLNNGNGLAVHSRRYMPSPKERERRIPTPRRRFLVKFGDLNDELRTEIQASVNAQQQGIHDRAREYRMEYPRVNLRSRTRALIHSSVPSPRRIPLEKPPATFELGNEDTLILISHSTQGGHPGLEVGEKLYARAHKPHDKTKYYLGTIAGFTLN